MRYPGSFLKLLLAGFTLVALPLVVALITSAIAVDRLARRSQSTIYQAVQATHSSRRLGESLTAMERTARQIVILNDRSLLDTYLIGRKQFEQTANELSRLTSDPELLQEVDAIVRTEEQIFSALSDPALKPVVLQAPVSRFSELSNRAQLIMSKSGQLIDREVDAMRKGAIDTQRVMLWQALSLLPVILFLIAGFTLLIARPIRQLDAAIRDLGDGNFTLPVVVNGPADLEYLGERLDWMRRQLLDIERQKNRFLQQISHELKTPLSALREGAQLLSDDVVGKLTPEQREIAQILRQNSIELQRRIEELLDYGALQFRKLELELAPVDMRAVLDKVVQTRKLTLQARNITLDTKVAGTEIVADADKMRVVLDNLLSNAIKFSPDGGTIAISMHDEAEDFIIDVSDQGPGIAADDESRVFEPFYQGREQPTGPVKGTGLGLSIVKEYVTAHGGNVALVTGGRGAHLRVKLPLARAEVA